MGKSDLQARPIFHAALSLADSDQRDMYLDAACQGDVDLREQVVSLLDAHSNANDFMEIPAATAENAHVPPSDDSRDNVDHYKLLQQIGEGGFGNVYMADQLKPIRRRVAVKIIKAGMNTKQVIARFEAERQALALMDHAHIAKVFDAGTTHEGRPYFSMELVQGIPVTDYCDDRGFTTRQRLQVFLKVCSAIQHAHQKGVVHRDIKPSNILVATDGDRPVPKVIDFGIAKAIQGRLTDKTLFTNFQQFIGTPAYMSPEQAQMSAVDVDTRSDIYSLGILLYELLTGRTPLNPKDLRQAGFDELCRRIRKEEAPRLSQQLSSLSRNEISTLAENRCVDAAKLRVELRGELEWIVVKAVDKDRSRRYPTVEAFASDIQRHLEGEAITAAPPSAIYRLRKSYRRHQPWFLSIGAVTTTLLMAAILSTTLVFRLADEVNQKDLAIRQAVEAKQTVEDEKRLAKDHAYASDMIGASQALRLGNWGQARFLVDRHGVPEADDDLRHWEWRALWKQSRGDNVVMFGMPQDTVWRLRVSPNNKWLVTRSETNIRVWNLSTHSLHKTLIADSSLASGRGIEFSPSGDRLFVATADGAIRSWSLPSFEEQASAYLGSEQITDICLSHDGTKMAVIRDGPTNQLSIWNVSSEGLDHEIVQTGIPSGQVRVAFSPHDQQLAVGVGAETRLLTVETLKEQFRIPAAAVEALAFSPDGELLACAAGFPVHVVMLYRTDGEFLGKLEGHTSTVWDLAFSPTANSLATVSSDHTVRVWDTTALQEVAILRGHTTEICSLSYTPGGRQLLTAGRGEICVFELDDETEPDWPITKDVIAYERDGWQRQYSQASFSCDSKMIATRNRDLTVSLRSAKTLEELAHLDVLGNQVRGVRFSPTEDLLAVGDMEGNLWFVDPNDVAAAKCHSLAEVGRVSPVEFCRDGTLLLVVIQKESETQYVVWSVSQSRKMEAWSVAELDKCAIMSPNGRTVVTAHERGVARFWDVLDPSSPHKMNFDQPIFSMAFAPDGSQIAVGTNKLHLINVERRQRVATMPAHFSMVHSIAYSADGQRLITGGGNSGIDAVKIWNVNTRQELIPLMADGFSFRQIEFSPDGDSIIAIGGTNSLKLWRAPTPGGS